MESECTIATDGVATMTATTPLRARGFNPNIQGARGLFSLAVFVFHVHNSRLPTFGFLASGLPAFLLTTLQFGVEMFFCISGFVIAGTLRRAATPRHFLFDRLLRLCPVLWATMPAVLCLEYLAHRPVLAGLSPLHFGIVLAANLLCLAPVLPVPLFHSAAWSLSYELLFYSVCAVIWMVRSQKLVLFMALSLAALILCFFPAGIFFLTGLVVAEGLTDSLPLQARLARYPLSFLLIFLVAWGILLELDDNKFQGGIWGWWNDSRLPLAILAFLASVPFFQGLAEGGGLLGRFLRSRLMQWLGLTSYSFYLWQFLTMGVTKRILYDSGLVTYVGVWSQAIFLLLALPPTLLISWQSQRLLEIGLTSRLRRWANTKAGQ